MACCLFDSKLLSEQWWIIFKWTILDKFQLKYNQDATISIQENTFQNAICKMHFREENNLHFDG